MPPTAAFPKTVSFPDVTGVILAGGQSQRMGRDKASLVFAGQTLFERVIAVLRPLFPTLLIAGDRPDLARADIACVADLYPGSALGGLYTALRQAQTPYIFATACDMPFIRSDLVRAIVARRAQCDVVVPRLPGGFEPLFALYHKNCLGPMREMLEEGNFRIFDFYPRVRTCPIASSELPAGWPAALRNINTPDEFCRLKENKE